MKFNWQRCFKVSDRPISGELGLHELDDNLPMDLDLAGLGIYFVPIKNSCITVGWFDRECKLFIPRCAITLEEAYKPIDVFMWAYIEEKVQPDGTD
jgi:hypothetical protein